MMKPIAVMGLVLAIGGIALAAILPDTMPEPDGERSVPDSVRLAQLRAKVAGEFRRVAAAYRRTGNISMEMEHRVYASYDSDSLLESVRGSVRRGGRWLYNDNFGSTTILIDTLLIQIDDEGRQILLSRPLDALPQDLPSDALDIEASLDLCDSVGYIDAPAGRTAYRLWYGPESQFRYIDLEVDRASGFVVRTVLYVAPDEEKKSEPMRVEIAYSNISTAPLDPASFTPSAYFLREGGHLNGVGKYAGYDIVDLRTGGRR